MIKIDKKKKILLDADVIIHFSKGEQLGILNKIFQNKLYILQHVLKEIFTLSLRTEIENLIRFKIIHELEFPSNFEVLNEYAKLKRTFGSGESACMAYCRYFQGYIG